MLPEVMKKTAAQCLDLVYMFWHHPGFWYDWVQMLSEYWNQQVLVFRFEPDLKITMNQVFPTWSWGNLFLFFWLSMAYFKTFYKRKHSILMSFDDLLFLIRYWHLMISKTLHGSFIYIFTSVGTNGEQCVQWPLTFTDTNASRFWPMTGPAS